MRAAEALAAAKRIREAARPIVYAAVLDGADTFGKIRKVTGLAAQAIRAALLYWRNYERKTYRLARSGKRRIICTGKRYSLED